jgi:hypothetical protein
MRAEERNHMCVAVRKQQHIAGFETKRMPAAPFQQAISRRHDVELRPARRLGIVRDVPLRSEPAGVPAGRGATARWR